MTFPTKWRESWTVWAAIVYALYRIAVAFGAPVFQPTAELHGSIEAAVALLTAIAPSVIAIVLRMRRTWFGASA